jgi:hypothetical protein
MDEYLKYMLWDPNYMGKDMYVMHHIGSMNSPLVQMLIYF